MPSAPPPAAARTAPPAERSAEPPAGLPAVDPAWPPPLALLLGPGAHDLVAVALAEIGGELLDLHVRNVSVQPSGATVARYEATVGIDGRRAPVTLAATTGARIPPGAAVVAGTAGGATVEVGLWRWPLDPALPGLARVTDPARLAALLAVAGAPAAAPQVRVRAYRPGRRAVLEVTGALRRLFVKVVRPDALAGLCGRHDLLVAHVPTPPVLAATDDGVLVAPALPGAPLRARLGDPADRPDGPTLDALLDRFPADVAALPAGRRYPPGDHLARVPHFAGVLACTAVTGADARRRLAAL
ncbi:MAG: hypothetical protein ACT4RN_12070, partial [Pseudonocardia sp.]